ncbi:MAG TPA: transposase [Woeseiaceae bacterium]|nr:transposase [Woeseiaceae bacterium]
MPRAHRHYSPGLVWHITHRCHQREYLLRLLRDRKRWRHWLYVAQRRHGLCILNYIVTCNHIHLLVKDRGNGEIARSMQLVAGRTAQEYNRREHRRGAFWEDRYHATAVQADEHLARCITYIDLNMVRADVVDHPRDWRFSGYHELCNPPQRKSVVDVPVLCELYRVTSVQQLLAARDRAINGEIAYSSRRAIWSSSAAVGNAGFLAEFQRSLGPAGIRKRCYRSEHGEYLREERPRYDVQIGMESPN